MNEANRQGRVRAYLASRPGDLVTVADIAAGLGESESAVEYALRLLSVSGDCELTRRQGGWVYRPASGSR